VKSIRVLCVLALCATAAVAARLPPGTYSQHNEGGDHAAASFLGGYCVLFDGQMFAWNGSLYTNGLATLEFIELPDGEYGWILVAPDHVDTGIVAPAR